MRGHVCQQLFYLDVDDYVLEDAVPVGDAAAAAALREKPAAPELPNANAFVVSLHAVVGIRTENTMLLPVLVKGERLLVLLHNFLRGTTMRHLDLSPAGGEQLCVTVANGDRLPCEGIACDVPISIAGEVFSITCVALDLGGFDLILGVDYLRTLGPILWDFGAMTMAFS